MTFQGDKSALVVLVPEADFLVKPFRDGHDPVAQLGVPAHITILFPFLPPSEIHEGVLQQLDSLFAKHARFSFQLTQICHFSKTLWLATTTPQIFNQLTHSAVTIFPQCPPYEGLYDELIPHLTVADQKSPETLLALSQEFEAIAQPHLPVDCCANKVTLLIRHQGYWKTTYSFSLQA